LQTLFVAEDKFTLVLDADSREGSLPSLGWADLQG